MTVAADAPPGRSATPSTRVDDVSFTVEQGESVGLMGLNGSGKSTLLKLINGVMRPDGGQVLTRGRIAGLIATGAGFHPQLTGRDNIYLNAADPRHERGRDRAQVRRDRRVRRHRQVPRHPGRPLHLGHVRPARLRGRHPRRLRHLPRRRGARGGGPPVQEKCLERMQEIRDERPHARSTSATPPARCARCATGCSCSRRAGSASTAPSTRASSTSTTTTDDDDPEDDRGRGARRRHLSADPGPKVLRSSRIA